MHPSCFLLSRMLPFRSIMPLFALALCAGRVSASLPKFPASWGEPPAIQTMDFGPLAGGYGHGPSSLSRWIFDNINKDISARNPQYPPEFGEPPKAQTRDFRVLPFGYGMGSGTLAKWLEKKAKEVYDESPDEYKDVERPMMRHARRDFRPFEEVM
eukprot:TRINITY_DN37355_c0_g1_i1.p1 TRINITY_DN37355_c0_g1~~TRINITY_DN37355_c0_g1_i1.p1  ORF type:complete len:156 (-),score=22.62 TRINITY_DN37355_c0_g1_i1:69-536(-)